MGNLSYPAYIGWLICHHSRGVFLVIDAENMISLSVQQGVTFSWSPADEYQYFFLTLPYFA